jgi:flagellar protein FlgJ
MALGNSSLAIDARSLDGLKARAAADPKAATREAAKQFEQLFMAELVKSMRASTMQTGMLDNAGSKMGTEMLDTQLSQQLSGLPGGLSDLIQRQLERQIGLSPGPIPKTTSANNTPAPIAKDPVPTRIPQTGAAGFVQQHTEGARAAEAATGIPANFMIAQAAHETGWGRKEILHGDGSPSYNLFGIKAGADWKGAVAEIPTTEYVNGKPQRVIAKFRAYGSYAESFADYAKLMKDSPRYAAVTSDTARTADASTFARGLQKAGYATDPAYADKLTRVINTTLRLQRSMNA